MRKAKSPNAWGFDLVIQHRYYSLPIGDVVRNPAIGATPIDFACSSPIVETENFVERLILSFPFLVGTAFLVLSHTTVAIQRTTLHPESTSHFHKPFLEDIRISQHVSAATPDDGIVRADWYKTIVPSEHYDSARTHRFPEAAFTGDISGGNRVSATAFEGIYPTPYNLVTRDD